MVFVAVPELLAGLIATGGATKLALGLFVGALAGSLMYNAVFVMISVVTTRAIAVGLLYALIWEGVLANLVAGARLLSVGQYSLGIANSIAHDPSLNAGAQPVHGRRPGPARDRRLAGHRGPQAGLVLDQGRAWPRLARAGPLSGGCPGRAGRRGRAPARSPRPPRGCAPCSLQRRRVGGERVGRRAVLAPPGVGAGVDAVRGGGEGGDVLAGVAWGGHQPDGAGEGEIAGLPADPEVAAGRWPSGRGCPRPGKSAALTVWSGW